MSAQIIQLGTPEVRSKTFYSGDAELLRLGAELEQIDRKWADMSDGERADALDDVWPLIDKIMSLKPRTAGGLVVQTRAIVFDNFDWWDGFEDDSEQGRGRRFLESLCTHFGITAGPIERSKVTNA
jgi:hypothetical protein